MLKSFGLLAFIGLLSSFSRAGFFSAEPVEPPITAQNVPDAKCVYKNKSLDVSGSGLRIHQFEVYTIRRGTETREPEVRLHLRLRDSNFKNVGSDMILLNNHYLGWTALDRFMRPKTISEVTNVRGVDIGSQKFDIVIKRIVPDVWSEKPVVFSEIKIFTPGEQPKLVVNASCETDIKLKSK